MMAIFATKCPHGVRGGKTQDLCDRCVSERKDLEEGLRRERGFQERRERIDFAADGLARRERLRLAKSLKWNIEELRSLSWQDFEDEIARMFERMGFTVEQTPYVNDKGRDAILRKDGQKYLLECKRYGERNVSGRPDLQKFHSAIITDHAVSGFFVTTGRFSNEAKEFASTSGKMTLFDQDELTRMMFDSKPNAADDDLYRSICRQCEETVYHRLRAPRSIKCSNGHLVAPTLNVESVLWVSAQPETRYAGSPPTRPSRPKRR